MPTVEKLVLASWFPSRLEAGSINTSSKELKKMEVEIITEIFVLYLRVLR